MRAKEVLQRLNISRVTLSHYVTKGLLKVKKLSNGYYDYDKESVEKLAGNDNRYSVIYCRVSTQKQKKDLEKQVKYVSDFCNKNNIKIKTTYSEINSGIDMDRPKFSKLLFDVLNYKVSAIYISHRDRLSRIAFTALEYIFKKFNTTIIIVSDTLNKANKTDDEEFFEDLLSLMHHFSTKLYSHRRKNSYNIKQ